MGSSLSALDVLLRVTSTGEVIIGDGTGSYVLSNAELDRIVTPDIIIDAMANDVRVDDVTFTADTGSNSFNVATTADINLAGDVTASGAGRTFRFGGFASPDMSGDDGLATRVVANIDDASFDFGASTLVVRGEDIVFGRDAFVDEVVDRTSMDLAGSLIGNSGSSLFNPLISGQLSTIRAADPVYLRAGNLVVVYENSALFQNTGFNTGDVSQTIGVIIGEAGGSGTLTIDTVDAVSYTHLTLPTIYSV